MGGLHAGVGKTALVCRLLEALPHWGALKTSPLAPGGPPFELLDGRERLCEPGSDTARYLAAGAARVLWLRYTPEGLGAGLQAAWEAFGPALGGVVVEGNSWTQGQRPERFLLLGRVPLREIKPSARRAAALADLVVLNRSRRDAAELVLRSARALAGAVGGHPWIADLSDPREPGCAALVERVLTWARRRP